jgi:hypothetical protein
VGCARAGGGPGLGLTSAGRYARDKPRFTDTLDVMKFICKDIWIMVFKKQIDNLKTNHRVRCPVEGARQKVLTTCRASTC